MPKNKGEEVIEYKNLKEFPEKKADYCSLIEQAFKYDDYNSYEKDFFPLFIDKNLEHCHYLEIDNDIAATIALYKTHLIYKDKLLPVTFMGGIAVADQYRGHGIFKMFFSKLLNQYHKETALFILWTGDPEIYQAWEFFPFGYISEKEVIKKAKNLNSVTINDQLKKLIESQYKDNALNNVIHHRDEDFWSNFYSHSTAKVFTDDQQTKYALCSKGFDLKNICHESTGLNSPDFQIEANSFWSPEIDNDVAGRYMGQMKLSNLDLLNQWFKDIGSSVQLSSKSTLHFGQEVFQLEQHEVIQGIFGPSWFEEIKKEVPPIWIGGIDSI
ncbi:MAG: GNAT family N-acetyltransferase [Oligoflexia bacterium]|nr:GNAT family N-acetyltransferase [Oligoflexia bacterium]